jgi:hypothetical protein
MQSSDLRALIETITRASLWPPQAASSVRRAGVNARVLRRIGATSRSRTDRPLRRSQRFVLGAHAEGIPVVFALQGTPQDVAVSLGTCVFDADPTGASIAQRTTVFDRLLHFAYPSVQADEHPSVIMRQDSACLWVGVPASGKLHSMLRALARMPFTVLVLAEPLGRQHVGDFLEEAGRVEREVLAVVADSKLKEPAVKLLEAHVRRFVRRMQLAATVGAWRVAVYVLADAKDAAAARAIFAATYGHSTPALERLSFWASPEAGHWAAQWALPDASWQHSFVPFPWQTVLTTRELAGLTCLPAEEVPGFRLLDRPTFDVMPPALPGPSKDQPAAPTITIGEVLAEDRPLGISYRVPTDQLTKHCFVAGTTGSGKTNTTFQLLHQLTAAKIPFLVIEPAKTEYRALIRDAEFRDLRVFTLGNELGVPLRFNPLAPEAGTSIASHIDLLKGVINSSIGAWNPLPQILEKALHRVFADAGWDVAADANHRIEASSAPSPPPPSAFPTFAELLDAALAATRELGYSERVGPDLEAALRVRIDSLLTGGKGQMLGTSEQLDMEWLVSRPTVLELESMADEDECAFVMGVLLIRLVEYLRRLGNTSDCRLVIVIEEAHRLLGQVREGNPEVGSNARFKAVSMFSHLLSEVRAYGAGFVICDQSPSKLTADVLKNTNLKIAHRIVAADDAATLAGTMRLRKDQAGALASFAPGTAAVFSEGDDFPVLVRVPKRKVARAWPSNDELPRDPDDAVEAVPALELMLAQQVEWLDAVERLLNILVAAPEGAPRAWLGLHDAAEHMLAAQRDLPAVVWRVGRRSLARLVATRGRIYGWSHVEVDGLVAALDPVVLALARGEYEPYGESEAAFRPLVRRLHRRSGSPLPCCTLSCGSSGNIVCPFRATAARLSDRWAGERATAPQKTNGELEQALEEASREAGDFMLSSAAGAPSTVVETAAFCFAQHALRDKKGRWSPRRIEETSSRIWARLRVPRSESSEPAE